jgi:alpha-glucosidase
VRDELRGPEVLEWVPSAEAVVVRFRRPGGWEVAMNFGTAPAALPPGEVLVASGPLADGRLPGETAVWLRV